jgi:hypothetical protein
MRGCFTHEFMTFRRKVIRTSFYTYFEHGIDFWAP